MWPVRCPRRREKSTEPYHLEEGEVVTRSELRVQAQKGTDGVTGCPIGAGGMLGLRPMGPDGGLDLLTDGGGG
ncbi:hypothetical protein V6N13_037063 [Hibiscus sabdariffa]